MENQPDMSRPEGKATQPEPTEGRGEGRRVEPEIVA